MARLVIFDETVRGVDLPDHAVIVGRSRRVDIPIRDRLLSRKHCTIIPVSGSGPQAREAEGGGCPYRVIDLKSANGTFVNGDRVERRDLEFDDVIEIGNTVIVLLDTDNWKRGEGLTRLRNPLKAQELIQRLNRHVLKKSEAAWAVRTAAAPQPRGGHEAPAAFEDEPSPSFIDWARSELSRPSLLQELMVDHVLQQVAALLVRELPELREALFKVLKRLQAPQSLQGDRLTLHSKVRAVLMELLSPPADAGGLPRSEVLGSPAEGHKREEREAREGEDRRSGHGDGSAAEPVVTASTACGGDEETPHEANEQPAAPEREEETP